MQATSTPFLFRSSPVSTATLIFSFGYFLTDIFMFMFYFSHGTVAMNIHHICALISVTISAFTGQGHPYVLLVLSTEVTTPLVNARWLLDKGGLKQHKLYFINGITMMVMWFFVRIVFMVFYFFPLMYRHQGELVMLNSVYKWFLLTIPPLLTVLNMYWFSKMVRGAMRLLSKKKKPE
jgi:TLC domain